MEIILERMTNVAMGTEIDNVVEFDDDLDIPENRRSSIPPSHVGAQTYFIWF